MSGSLFLRTLRGAALFAAGMLVAGTGISIGAPTTAATTQTRVASCSGLNFHPISHRTAYNFTGRMLYRRANPDNDDGWFLCDPHLPHRAVVTRLRFTLRDDTPFQSVQWCALQRSSLAAGSGDSQTLGVVSATGVGETPGYVRRSDTSISRATIDNGAYSYWLQCQITFPQDVTAVGPQAAIIGADVTYKISSTNG